MDQTLQTEDKNYQMDILKFHVLFPKDTFKT